MAVAGHNFTMQFSSYPGSLCVRCSQRLCAIRTPFVLRCACAAGSISSTDDFFQMNTGLVVMETTNDMFNTSMFDIVVPQTLLSWTRAVVSNTVARSGPQWGNMFGWYNSGTYSNMWIVVDFNKFRPGKPLLDNALTIAEQLPGWCRFDVVLMSIISGRMRVLDDVLAQASWQ
jgi:hypothetical protein